MDSIVKNVGRRYLSRFAENLFHTFTNAYTVAPPTVRMSLRRMLATWPDIYGFELVNAMTARADQCDATPYNPLHAPHRSAVRVPSQQAPPYFAQQQRVPMPPHTPELRPQPIRPAAAVAVATSAAQLPHGAGRGLPMRPPALRSNQPPPAVMPQPPQEFVELERTMTQVIRNASMGTLPSNHQLFTLNRTITTQLQSSATQLQRSALLRYQQQLREISSAPRHRAAPAPKTSHISATPSAPPSSSQVPGPHVSATLTNLLRAMPPGLLHTVQSVAHSSRPLPSATVGTLPSPAAMPRPSGVPRRLPDTAGPSYSAPSPTVLTFAELKGMSHHAGVRSLYTDLPYLSKSDGMRFATKEALREHLDWLFRQNRRKRGTKEQVVVGGQSRGWFDALDVFLGNVDPNAKPTKPSVNNNTVADENDDRTVSVVESKSDNDKCAACHEVFETFWDDDKHAWMLRDCTKTDDDELYHVNCMRYAVLADDESADASTRQQPEHGTSKAENEKSDTALTRTNDKPLEPQTNTNSHTPQKPTTTAADTAALTPTAKQEPQPAIHTSFNQSMVSQISITKGEPNMIPVDSQRRNDVQTAPAYVMPLKQEPHMARPADAINSRPIPPIAGLNMVPPASMAAGPEVKGKVIISKVPKWLASTTGIKVMHLEPARKEGPRISSTSPPGQKRKRSESENVKLEPQNMNTYVPTFTALSVPMAGEGAEPQSKRQKECSPQTNT
eukprot:TRINITY_DN893_c0_g1_i1.p1 TRINITY_DN893_c0_g1~~TRINITY_DN893_c0_g1_i1.p1  ORF type:complete len:809 (-),score=140.83 TRINITY_DN893_c0_g1_i1:1448-3631(-)